MKDFCSSQANRSYRSTYPKSTLGGPLQTCGAATNAKLFHSSGNRWLASAVLFAVITAFFLCNFAMFPNPLPTGEGLANMPWWATVDRDSAQVMGGRHVLSVTACGGSSPTTDRISVLLNQRGDYLPSFRQALDYENALKEWRDKYTLGTRLKPNENGRHWPSRGDRQHATQ